MISLPSIGLCEKSNGQRHLDPVLNLVSQSTACMHIKPGAFFPVVPLLKF